MADNPGIPEGLPLIEAACTADDLALGSGAAFWENLDEAVARYGLDASLDRALAGRATPRVWVLVHEPGHPRLAAAAALGFARALADRGQAALVLDGDDQATVLSRWAGRQDAEGWIDIVRYGTSVLTSGVALPFAGRAAYLLGVGSYAPTDVTPQEIDQLLARLRRQADDVLVVLPGGAHAAAWARRADIRLLCHDQAELTPPRLAAVVANLAAAGVAPTALVGFGRALPAAAPAGAEPAAAPEPVRQHETEAPAATEPSVAAALASLEVDEKMGQDPSPEQEEAAYARRQGSSRVFWLVAVTATVLIGLVGVYYLKFLRVPDGSVFEGVPTLAVQPPVAHDAAVPDTVLTVAAAGPDSQLTEAPAGAGVDTAGPGPTVALESGADPATDETAGGPDTPAVDTAPAPAEDEAADPAAPVFDPAPYQVPVGTDGWAVQVYSFRDSASAGQEMATLGRHGLRSAVRVVELPGSGRWWRIYVGSFPDRQAARAALPALFGKLRIDWAQPARFTVAVTDTAGR